MATKQDQIGPAHRELDPWEMVREDAGLEALWCGSWRSLDSLEMRCSMPGTYDGFKTDGWTIRTKINVPQPFPPLSQEAKDAMDRDGKAMLELASTISKGSQDRKETVHTMDGVKEPMVLGPSALEATKEGQHATRIPDPSAPLKTFTQNKYTRDMPTLDGRKVPVDVYCVLAAFPTGSAAVDHAIKKQLAPGQRGTKTRLQDLKEARASLDRAIELEEADAP